MGTITAILAGLLLRAMFSVFMLERRVGALEKEVGRLKIEQEG